MKTQTRILMWGAFAALLLAVTPTLPAQDARFFRVAGPVVSSISEFRTDGTLVWTSTPTNATFTVQLATSLAGGTNWVDYVQIPATNGLNTNRLMDFNPPAGMALIPAGSFTMGNCMSSSEGYSDELPLHTVYVSAFYMDKTEVSKAQWDEVYNWAITHGYSFDYGAMGKAANHPAQSMTWYDAVKWCNARSEKEGRVPAYYTDVGLTLVYKSGEVSPYVKWNSGYRLPTEAEWEKAARGGASGQRFPWGNTITWSQANYYAYPLSTDPVYGYAYDVNATEGFHPAFATGEYPYTSPVGYFAPNGYGLYDMSGNVWEWCWDWYGSHSSASQSDPRGPISGSLCVFRGGSWDDLAYRCRAADRNSGLPSYRSFYVGFRSARAADQ